MCGKNREKSSSAEQKQWSDVDSSLQNIDLVVVGVENETETANAVLYRLLDEGDRVPINLDPLNLPPWFEVEKFKRGQRYFYNNYYAMFVSKLCGLIIVLSIPSVLKILILTGKSSTPPKAFRRYMDTISNMLDWYCGDLMKETSNIYKVLLTVRGKHCAAGKKSVTSGTGIISQRDMALTQFGFMGVAILKPKFLGIKGCEKDVEGFIHFWRTIGYCMGIEDRFNICNGSVNQVREICEKISQQIFRPQLERPHENFNAMAEALLAGMKPVVPFMTVPGFMEFTRRILNIEPSRLEGLYSRYLLSYLIFQHNVLLGIWWIAFIVRPVLNWMLRFAVYCNIKYPLYASISWGKEIWDDEASILPCQKQRVEAVR